MGGGGPSKIARTLNLTVDPNSGWNRECCTVYGNIKKSLTCPSVARTEDRRREELTMGFSDQISGFLFTNGLLLLVFNVNIITFPLMLKWYWTLQFDRQSSFNSKYKCYSHKQYIKLWIQCSEVVERLKGVVILWLKGYLFLLI